MSQHFSRILTLLRSERKLSQKQAAADLGISPAVLSHYENGIRECKLDFLVSVADYYEVSCDYLLGRTSEPAGMPAPAQFPPKKEVVNTLRTSHRTYASGQKKTIMGALHIVYDVLSRGKNKALTSEVSRSFMVLIYRVFWMMYSSNSENPGGIFSLSKSHVEGLSDAALRLSLSHVKAFLRLQKGTGDKVKLSPRMIRERYPTYAPSLFSVIRKAEQCADFRWETDVSD